MTDQTSSLTSRERRVLTDIDDGHLTLWIGLGDGMSVTCDRSVVGMHGEWWIPLVERGLLAEFPLGDGRRIYRPTDTALDLLRR